MVITLSTGSIGRANTTGTSINFGLGATPADGDVLLACFTASSTEPVPSSPGWSDAGGDYTGAKVPKVYIRWRIWHTGDATSWTWTGLTSGQWMEVVVFACSGVDLTVPIGAQGSATNGNGQTATAYVNSLLLSWNVSTGSGITGPSSWSSFDAASFTQGNYEIATQARNVVTTWAIGQWSASANVQTAWIELHADGEPAGLTAPDPGTTTVSDLDNKLASWLINTGDNTHQSDGLPWLTQVDTQEMLSLLRIPGAPAGTIAGGILKWVWDNRDALLAAYNSLVNHFSGTPDPSAPHIDTNVLTLLSRTGTLLDDDLSMMAALSLIQDSLATQNPVPFPNAPWTLADETTFDTSLSWAVPADLYAVSFEDLGSGRVDTVVAGVNVSYRLAWWTFLNGDTAGERHFCDFPTAHLRWPDGSRMPGLLLHSPQGASGTVQAWTVR